MSEKVNKGPTFEALTDEMLFARFKRGDQEAFDVLLKRYQAPIFSLVLKSTRNRAEAEDLFQEVFFKVVERRDQFRESVSFKAWLYTVSRNTCIDAARKQKRRPATSSIFVDEEKPLEIRLASKNENPLDAAAGLELNTFLNEAVQVLPPEQRETFYLKVTGELTFEEIGEAMNCSVNTAKSRMRYALERLREVFKKRGYLK